MFNKKIITIIIAIVAALVVIGLLFTTYVMKKDNLYVAVAPRNAVVKLNDTVIESNKALYVEPGSYSLLITADGFRAEKQTITVTDTYKAFSFCLVPHDSTVENYIKTHPDDQYICEGAAGQAYDKEAQEAIAKYPIIAKLPYEDGTFSIGQGMTEDSKTETAIYIHYSSKQSKDDALNWIHRTQKENLPPIIYANDYSQTGRLGGVDSELDKKLVAKYPIVKILPIDAFIYKVGYRIDQSDPSGESIKLTVISDTPTGRMAALHEIYAHGYNPVDYKIEFLGFEGDIK
jgi:hypothetical protein